MPLAFVLISADAKKIKQILAAIQKTNGVIEAYSVAGPHDIVAKLQAEKFGEIADIVTQKLQGISGVRNTLTLFAFE
ncbi:MAG: Lrp/AsnC ligand binding domain-containing protein [Candidatus Hadarchaeota archaeon]